MVLVDGWLHATVQVRLSPALNEKSRGWTRKEVDQFAKLADRVAHILIDAIVKDTLKGGEGRCCAGRAQLIYSVMVGRYAYYIEFVDFTMEYPGPGGGKRARHICRDFSFNITGTARRYEIEMVFGQWPIMPPAPDARINEIIETELATKCAATAIDVPRADTSNSILSIRTEFENARLDFTAAHKALEGPIHNGLRENWRNLGVLFEHLNDDIYVMRNEHRTFSAIPGGCASAEVIRRTSLSAIGIPNRMMH